MLYNFSGHPVPDSDLDLCVGINFPHDAELLHQLIRDMLLRLSGREKLLAGAHACVILPGYSPAAAILLAEWHGQFGNWPNITWAIKGGTGFTFDGAPTADLNRIRESARTARII